jgi:hypothetical protein
MTMLLASARVGAADPGSITAWCDYLGSRLRSVSAETCRTQDYVAAKEITARGNLLVHRDIHAAPAKDTTNPARRVLVIGGIHGDELTSISTVFRWLDWAAQGPAAAYDWRIIPLANPDGFQARPSTRVNANGIDLNRNFPTPNWEKEADKYWVKRTRRDPRRHPGKTPASEVETRWLMAQIEEFKPDLIISLHAPYNLLDYDGPVPKPLRFGRLSLSRLGVYPGSLGNYGGLYKKIPVITIELPNATSMPNQKDQQAMWEDMLEWMNHNVRAVD